MFWEGWLKNQLGLLEMSVNQLVVSVKSEVQLHYSYVKLLEMNVWVDIND